MEGALADRCHYQLMVRDVDEMSLDVKSGLLMFLHWIRRVASIAVRRTGAC